MKPRAIFFDLDDTLFDDVASIQLALAAVHAGICEGIHGVDAATMARTYLLHSDAYWLTTTFSRNDIEEVRRELWRKALVDLGCDDLECAQTAADSYSRHRALFAQTYPDTVHTLDRLHGRYKLAVITNGSGFHQRSRLKHSGLDRYFDVVVASTDIDSGKPDPAIFRHVLERLDLRSSEAWHVGDQLRSDVAGAHNAGLTSVWVNRLAAPQDGQHPRPHHEISQLTELLSLLD